MGQWVGAQGRLNLAKIFKTCPHSDVTFRKPTTEKKVFFSISTKRLAESVDCLDSSLAQLPGQL